jgi:hypothetical protein
MSEAATQRLRSGRLHVLVSFHEPAWILVSWSAESINLFFEF